MGILGRTKTPGRAGLLMAPVFQVVPVAGLILVLQLHPAMGQNPQQRILSQVGLDQKLDEQVPLELVFRDEEGHRVSLGDYFRGKPVILALVYYECPMLCNLILNGLAASLKTLAFDVGREFEVVTVSFDPRETPELAAAKKHSYVQQYGRPGASEGWHFLTGDETSVAALTEAVGFRYAWDEETQQFAHAGAILILTPEGRLARYLYGVEYPPRDLRLALVEASENKIGSPVDQLLLLCFHYDPMTGKYGFVIMSALRILGLATLLALGTFIFIMVRRDLKGDGTGTASARDARETEA